ncbi:MAG: hypothetical protein WAU01_03685 [Saprospiraceae bacterium]
MMNDIILKSFSEIDFVNRYKEICNAYTDFDNGKSFKKGEVQELLQENNLDLEFSSKEKLFLKNYRFGDLNLRFILSYNYGFIDCMYTCWTDNFDFRLNESLSGMAMLIDENFESKVKYKFPIATSSSDFEKIIEELSNLHIDFIESVQCRL